MMPKSKQNILALALRTWILVALSGPPSFSALVSFRYRPTFGGIGAAQEQEGGARKDQGTLRVTVVTRAGQKIAGAAISIQPEGKPPTLKALTRNDGAYLSPKIAAGRYQISVVVPCYQPWRGSLEVLPDHERTVNVALQPSSAVADGTRCPALPKQIDTDVQFSDSAELKPGAVSGSVDAGGYSSQAQGTQLRTALGELPGGAGSSQSASADAESNVFSRGRNLLLQGDYQQAISAFQQGAAQYPDSGEMLLGLGVAYYSSGRYRDAVDALLKAVDRNPSDSAAYFFLAETYAASPVETEAVFSRLENYANRQPRNAAAQYYYALCLWRSGAAGQTPADAERVDQELHSAIALDPSLVEAHYQLGVVLAEQHQDAQAMTEFERVIALRPEFAEAHYRLAQICQRNGQKDRAQAELAAYDQLRKQSATRDQRLSDDVRKLLLGGGVASQN